MRIYRTIDRLIGDTPLFEPCGYLRSRAIKAHVYAKLEYLEPAGSVKDRVARSMLDTAEKSGKLKPGATVIEPTSGNTGIGLAAIGASRGYRVIIVMPDNMSAERIKTMKSYGAEVVLSDGKLGMSGAIALAAELAQKIKDSFIPGQFENQANPDAHYSSTGPEIFRDLDGAVDIFVSGVGTGGTLTGVGRYLRSKLPNVKTVAVEPSSSPVLSCGKRGAHKIQGIGAGFVPQTLDTDIIDEIITVDDEQAFEAARTVAKTDGLSVGISSGAALFAACELAQRPENENKNIVTVFPDGGARYFSAGLYD